MWNEVIGHKQNKDFLRKWILSAKKPHALLFVGAEGIGKRLLAEYFAKTVLCLKQGTEPCGQCEACRLMDVADKSFAHKDFYLVQPEAQGKDIKIDQIKEMSKQMQYAPVLSSQKVCIIDHAEKMTVEAANSLLKLLEEPPVGRLFVLISSQAENILPTILSRVIKIRFGNLEPQETAEILCKHQITENVDVLAALAENSPGKAIMMAEQEAVKKREVVLGILSELPQAKPVYFISTQRWVEKTEKTVMLLYLELIITVLRDMLLVKVEVAQYIRHKDIEDEIKKLAAKWQVKSLKKAVNEAIAAEASLKANVGAKAVFETLMLKLDALIKE